MTGEGFYRTFCEQAVSASDDTVIVMKAGGDVTLRLSEPDLYLTVDEARMVALALAAAAHEAEWGHQSVGEPSKESP